MIFSDYIILVDCLLHLIISTIRAGIVCLAHHSSVVSRVRCMCVHAYSVMSDSVTSWTVTYQDPPSIELSRQEYWSGLPFPSPEDPSDPGIELTSLGSSAVATAPSGKPPMHNKCSTDIY